MRLFHERFLKVSQLTSEKALSAPDILSSLSEASFSKIIMYLCSYKSFRSEPDPTEFLWEQTSQDE